MAINKKTREAVYQKYGGRCAYCGRAITYKDMQVDHFRPLRVWNKADGAADDISNLMPACRMCNHYKRANSLEVFRRYIAEIPRKLRSDYIYKIGVAYGNVVENEKPIAFFFETQDAYGYGEITADRRDKLTDLWEAREASKNSRKGSDKYTDLVTEMLETAIRRVGNEYADMLFEYDRQRREAEKQCEQLAMEGMMKK